jgi:hypothetical protein
MADTAAYSRRCTACGVEETLKLDIIILRVMSSMKGTEKQNVNNKNKKII